VRHKVQRVSLKPRAPWKLVVSPRRIYPEDRRLIDQIIEESEARDGLMVETIHFKLGVFSSVDKTALRFV
jgi:hypothetical protein